MRKIDLVGQVFDRLTVVSEAGRDKFGRMTWNCTCVCGKTRIVQSNNLRTGHTTSCGCAQTDMLVKRNTTHGLERGEVYQCWSGMKARCYNQKAVGYKNYGGRGIQVCEKWRESYASFYKDMGEKPDSTYSIERRDNNGNYAPENCYWATRIVQANNSRWNRIVTINGRTKNRTQWCKHFGISNSTVSGRLQRGWSIENALSRPIIEGHSRH